MCRLGIYCGVVVMSKLTSKSDVIECYWPDFLNYCMRSLEDVKPELGYVVPIAPTVDNFWAWYIRAGPLGLKHRGGSYSKDDVEYL